MPQLLPLVMEKKPKNPQTMEMGIDILNLLATKFAYNIKREKSLLDRMKDQNLIDTLMNYTTAKSDLVRRRASLCLGS